MDKEIKEEWTRALESGAYAQGEGFLRDTDNTWCCLGVLTDLYIQAHELEWERRNDHNSFQGETAFLAGSVMDWAELPRDDPKVTVRGRKCTLSYLNDNDYTFPEIAAIIRKQL